MTQTRDFSSTPGQPGHVTFRVDNTFDNDEAVEDPPENYVMDHVAEHVMRPRAMSHHLSSTKVPSRRWLTVQARFWRACMSLGMRFHNYPRPKPPKPSFVHRIKTDTIPIELHFYVDPSYYTTCRLKPQHRFPVVVNFHGGGFCLGDATDDRYYARVILAHTSAIFVSVNYRRAPEHPFPVPVDDSVEALLYLVAHAEEYHIDPSKFALTGFSAGANLSLTVPFRLTFHTDRAQPRKYSTAESASHSEASSPNLSRINTRNVADSPRIDSPSPADHSPDRPTDSRARLISKGPTHNSKPVFRQTQSSGPSSTNDLSRSETNTSTLAPITPATADHTGHMHKRTAAKRPTLIQEQSSYRITRLLTPTPATYTASDYLSANNMPSRTTTNDSSQRPSTPKSGYEALKILTIVAWYPLLDWTSSRDSKRRLAVNPSKTLNPLFTNLFDYSYLPPPDHEGHHVSPYASPGLAPDSMLRHGLPERIQLWLCEYDMLLKEGKEFSDRLERLGKDISTTLIDGVPHGWDKSPNPFRDQAKIDHLYVAAAERLEDVFEKAHRKPGSVAGERIGLGGRQ